MHTTWTGRGRCALQWAAQTHEGVHVLRRTELVQPNASHPATVWYAVQMTSADGKQRKSVGLLVKSNQHGERLTALAPGRVRQKAHGALGLSLHLFHSGRDALQIPARSVASQFGGVAYASTRTSNPTWLSETDWERRWQNGL